MSTFNKISMLGRWLRVSKISQSLSHPPKPDSLRFLRHLSTPSIQQQPKQTKIEESKLFKGFIPMDKIDITFSRSTGAGGQNVNKVNTKVDLRFHVASAEWLSNEVKEKLLQEAKTKINKEGFLVIKSDVTRYQQMNVADALEKLRTLIRTVQQPPPEPSEETLEKIRRRQERAARERLMIKRQASETKQNRQAPTVSL